MSPSADRAAWAAALSTLLGAGVYLVTTATHLGLFYYLPTRGVWSASSPPGVIAMDWFARAMYTLLASGLGLWVGLSTEVSRTTTRAVWGLGLTVLAWALGFTALMLWNSR